MIVTSSGASSPHVFPARSRQPSCPQVHRRGRRACAKVPLVLITRCQTRPRPRGAARCSRRARRPGGVGDSRRRVAGLRSGRGKGALTLLHPSGVLQRSRGKGGTLVAGDVTGTQQEAAAAGDPLARVAPLRAASPGRPPGSGTAARAVVPRRHADGECCRVDVWRERAQSHSFATVSCQNGPVLLSGPVVSFLLCPVHKFLTGVYVPAKHSEYGARHCLQPPQNFAGGSGTPPPSQG